MHIPSRDKLKVIFATIRLDLGNTVFTALNTYYETKLFAILVLKSKMPLVR
jgi:hypothetical protein